jgi:hypothetical protein
MPSLGRFLSAATDTASVRPPCEFGYVDSWFGAGDNFVIIGGITYGGLFALDGLTIAAGDTIACIRTRTGWIAIGKVAATTVEEPP